MPSFVLFCRMGPYFALRSRISETSIITDQQHCQQEFYYLTGFFLRQPSQKSIIAGSGNGRHHSIREIVVVVVSKIKKKPSLVFVLLCRAANFEIFSLYLSRNYMEQFFWERNMLRHLFAASRQSFFFILYNGDLPSL